MGDLSRMYRPTLTDISPELLNELARIKLVVFDFDGVFTDNRVFVTEDGKESVACWRSDGLGLSTLKSFGVLMRVISTEANRVVSRRCEKLDIACIQACDDKRKALLEIMAETGVGHHETVYVGNDINDVGCLEIVGVPVVVADSHPDVLELGRYVTTGRGGRGAVREVCDLISLAKEEK